MGAMPAAAGTSPMVSFGGLAALAWRYRKTINCRLPNPGASGRLPALLFLAGLYTMLIRVLTGIITADLLKYVAAGYLRFGAGLLLAGQWTVSTGKNEKADLRRHRRFRPAAVFQQIAQIGRAHV